MQLCARSGGENDRHASAIGRTDVVGKAFGNSRRPHVSVHEINEGASLDVPARALHGREPDVADGKNRPIGVQDDQHGRKVRIVIKGSFSHKRIPHGAAQRRLSVYDRSVSRSSSQSRFLSAMSMNSCSISKKAFRITGSKWVPSPSLMMVMAFEWGNGGLYTRLLISAS